ncbi:hypothetical protein EDD11_005345 [Mortierella claussenii]|nr:hypothetical protein EDD11_005345 [Mortierella claussenii]
MNPPVNGPSKGTDTLGSALLAPTAASDPINMCTPGNSAISSNSISTITAPIAVGNSSSNSSTAVGPIVNASVRPKSLDDVGQEAYSPWDMPPIIQPVTSTPDARIASGLKGFSNFNPTWPHFRSKPHPTISVPVTPISFSRPSFDMAAPSTPPRNSSYSNAEDSDNAMCTPTFGSAGSSYSRRNSAVSVMALDTPPPLSLMDLESSSSSSLPVSSFGLGVGHGSSTHGHLSRSLESSLTSGSHGYPFPPFGVRHEAPSGISRRSSRANSVSMDSRHVRKPSEDTNMSDGGNNSGSERSRRHSPAVVPFERSVRRSALFPKPKGLLKVFSQLEVFYMRFIWSMMFVIGALILNDFQRQQEEYDKQYQIHQLQHLAQLQQQHHQQQKQQGQQPPLHSHPLQATLSMPDSQEPEGPESSSYLVNSTLMSSMPSSPLQAPMVTRSKRKSSTCEERFDPYHSSHLKRRAVSPSIGPIISHRRSPSSSPARHLAGHSRSKIAALPSPSGTGSFFRHGIGPLGAVSSGSHSGIHGGALDNSSATGDDGMITSRTNSSGVLIGTTSNGSNISSNLNLQHTSRSFSELSLDIPKGHAHS